jgi:hypothetical protein
MPSLTELSTAELREAGDAAETLIEFAEYLPPGGMLLMLAGKFRDEIRELLRMPPLARVSRGLGRKALDGLENAELYRLTKAVNTLLGHFEPYLQDPEMVRLLATVLDGIGIEFVAQPLAERAEAS